MWGAPSPFDRTNPFYLAIKKLAAIRASEPPLRYGRFYFRPLSGDGVNFGVSPFAGGVLAFSRILSRREVVVVANTSTNARFAGDVIVDSALNRDGGTLSVLFSTVVAAGPFRVRTTGPARIVEVDGSISPGPARVVSVDLAPMEAVILG
jgi:hypothetical protein